MLAHADTLGNWHKNLCTLIPTKLEAVPAKLEVLWFKLFTCWDVVEVALFLPFLPAPSALVRTILNPNYLWSQLVEALEWFSSIKCSRLLCLSFIMRLSSVAMATLTLKRRTVALFRFPQNFEFCKILPGFFPFSIFPGYFWAGECQLEAIKTMHWMFMMSSVDMVRTIRQMFFDFSMST